MGSTAKLALPYPEDTDPLANMAAAVEALANALDDAVNGAGRKQILVASSAATSTDLTLASLTITAPGAVDYELAFNWYNITKTVAGDVFLVTLREGGTTIAEWLSATGGTSGGSGFLRAFVTPTAGNHTYDVHLVRSSGTGTGALTAGAVVPASFTVRPVRLT